MKKLLLVIVLLFMISCANESKMSKTVDAVSADDLLEYEMASEKLTLEKMTSEKLKNYFELLQLQEEHPEFKDDIASQLIDLSKDGTRLLDAKRGFLVKNIRQVGETEKLSDSVQKIQLHYDAFIRNESFTDSVYAVITKKTIVISGKETFSTKVIFSKTD